MKKLDSLFNIKELATKIASIQSEKRPKGWVLLEPILDSPVTLEKMEKLITEWEITPEELPARKDPASRWSLFTRFANDQTGPLRTEINKLLEKKKGRKFHGSMEFRMVLDGSFGLYCNTDPEVELNQKPYTGDVIVERLLDGSFIITEHKGEMLGMADSWASCIDFVADHFDNAGYWDPDCEFEVNVFQRDEGSLYLVDFERYFDDDDDRDKEKEQDASKS